MYCKLAIKYVIPIFSLVFMTNVGILFAGNTFPCQGNILFFEGFDADSIPAGWQVHDVDSLTPNDAITWTGTWQIKDVDGDNVASNTSYYSPVGSSNDFLITPAIILPSQSACLSFIAKSKDAKWLESYEVRISTTTPSLTDTFSSSLFANAALYTEDSEESDWTTHTIDLSAYADDTVYIAFWHNADDKIAIYLDEVMITTPNALDVAMTSLDMDNNIPQGSYDVIGAFENIGSSTITELNVNWQLDNGSIQTDNLTGLSIAPYASYDFTHSKQFTLSNAGAYSITVWTDNLNLQTDENVANDTLTHFVAISNGESTFKRILIEGYTGAWCGVCTDGDYRIDTLHKNHIYKTIITQVHYLDAMEIDEFQGLVDDYGSQFPAIGIDRVTWKDIDDDQNGKLDTIVAISRNFWDLKITERLNATSPVDISMTKTYNATTRELSVTLTADFVDYVVGDVRFLVWIKENFVTGTGNGYDQQNFYNDHPQYPNHPMKGLGHPIVGYEHMDVIRELPLGAFGEEGSIPSKSSPDDNAVSKTFTYTIPAEYDESLIRVIGAVYRHDDDKFSREILNATIGTIWTTGVNEATKEIHSPSVTVYPNPVSGLSSVEFNLVNTSKVSVDIYNALGQKLITLKNGTLTSGSHLVYFDASNVPNGLYFVGVNIDGSNSMRKFIVAH